MNVEEADYGVDDPSSFDSPLRNVRSLSLPDTTITEHQDSRTHYFQAQLLRFQQSQQQIMALQLQKLQKGKSKQLIFCIAITGLLLMSLLALYSELQKLSFRVSELEYKQRESMSEVAQVQRVLLEQNQQMELLLGSNEKIKEEIIDLHMNELMKEERSMHVFQKYANAFAFQTDKQIDYLAEHFHSVAHGQTFEVRKRTDEELMVYSKQPVPKGGIYYLKVKIEETLYGMIGFGLIPSHRRHQKCVYCDSKDIFYIYCRNGEIYNGQTLQYLKHSKSSRFGKIKSGDTLTMFVDNKQRKVIWYVNSRYAGSQKLTDSVSEWYPFIEMTSRGDVVRIIG